MSDSNNLGSIESFEVDLFAYEKDVPQDSYHLKDYQNAAQHMAHALDRIVHASSADTYSMMRRLIAHITGKIDTAYSDVTINMVAAVSAFEYKQKIMAIFYVIRESILGEDISLSDAWLDMIGHNRAIWHFLNNYKHHSERITEESYSGVLLTPLRETKKTASVEDHHILAVANHNYQVFLEANKVQRLSLTKDDAYVAVIDQSTSKPLPIVTEIVITPTLGHFIFDKSLRFYDDAIAQLSALGCVQQGYVRGVDTIVTLPGMFYSVLINVVSYDEGVTFHVTEFNILPPALSRHL